MEYYGKNEIYARLLHKKLQTKYEQSKIIIIYEIN